MLWEQVCPSLLVKSHFLNICFQKKYEKFLEPNETPKVNRSHSSGSIKGLKTWITARRDSEAPTGHYPTRSTTDESNNTQTTLGRSFHQSNMHKDVSYITFFTECFLFFIKNNSLFNINWAKREFVLLYHNHGLRKYPL